MYHIKLMSPTMPFEVIHCAAVDQWCDSATFLSSRCDHI